MPWFQTDVYLQTLELSQAKHAFQSIVMIFLPTLDSTSKQFKKLWTQLWFINLTNKFNWLELKPRRVISHTGDSQTTSNVSTNIHNALSVYSVQCAKSICTHWILKHAAQACLFKVSSLSLSPDEVFSKYSPMLRVIVSSQGGNDLVYHFVHLVHIGCSEVWVREVGNLWKAQNSLIE